MYSRANFPKEPYHIPENYRGNAFQNGSKAPDLPIAPPEPPEENITEAPDAFPAAEEIPAPKETPAFLSSILPPKPNGLNGGGILGDIGAEELLIIGIILLISQNEPDDDIILLLLLLLFYK